MPRYVSHLRTTGSPIAQAEVDWINAQMEDISERRFNELIRVFSEATRLEADFWETGLMRL